MCGKETIIISFEHDSSKNEKAQQQPQENDSALSTIVEQIDGSYYAFDTAMCINVQKVQCGIW